MTMEFKKPAPLPSKPAASAPVTRSVASATSAKAYSAPALVPTTAKAVNQAPALTQAAFVASQRIASAANAAANAATSIPTATATPQRRTAPRPSSPNENTGIVVRQADIVGSSTPVAAKSGGGSSGGSSAIAVAEKEYAVPYVDEDKPYVPPPEAYEPYDVYKEEEAVKPAITNKFVPANALPLAMVMPVVKPSLLDRILGFFGLARSKTVNAKMAGEAAGMATMSRTDAAYSLVRRARNGDQNAMAMIAAVRDRALNGDKQAEVSVRLMHSYIEKNPTDRNADMGAETDEGDVGIRAAVELSHGPLLTKHRISGFLTSLTEYERAAFHHGMRGGAIKANQPQRVAAAHAFGKAVGAARVLQASRMSGVSLKNVNADVAWELE